MTSDSQRMRNVLNLVESANSTPTLLEGWLDSLKSKFSGKDKNVPRDAGEKDRLDMRDKLISEWETWLGRTHREGTLNDMLRFMTHRIGFKDEDIDAVIGRSGVLPKAEVKKAEQKANQGPDDKTAAPVVKPKDQMKQSGHDQEAGIPMPKDLNAKLSDYGDVKGESINEAPATAPQQADVSVEDQVLSHDMADKILDLSAALIHDEYLYNGPENDKNHAIAQAAAMGLGNQASQQGNGRPANPKAPIPANDGSQMGKGQYDSKEANNVLASLSISDSDVKRLTNKVKKINTLSDLSKTEREMLIGVAVALLRARS